MSECRACIYYDPIPKSKAGYRRGICRNPRSHYYELMRNGGDRAADRCYESETTEEKENGKVL